MLKDRDLLGVNPATANYQLHRRLLFALGERLGMLQCFRCGESITSIEDLSIEHKEAWRSAPDPRAAFFDLSNVAFSHVRCNCGAGERHRKYSTDAGRKTAYSRRNRERWNRHRREQRANNPRSAKGRLSASEAEHVGSNPALGANG